MKRRKLYMVVEEPGGPEWLSLRGEGYHESREATEAEIRLEELADVLDQNAESNNIHEYVHAHRALAALLFRMLGRDTAFDVLRRIADFGGMHAMLGIYGTGDIRAAEKALGVPLGSWKDWKLE